MNRQEELVRLLNRYGTAYYESDAPEISDAEYEMFNDKLTIKSAPGYREKLEKGIGR